MKIAVIGPRGQLGSELVKQGCIPLHGTLFDLVLEDELSYLNINPDAIINCAAYTRVDGCELVPRLAASTNATELARLSQNFSGCLVQMSTDYIFDGLNGPYAPNAPPNPLSIYGWSKLGGELVTRRHPGAWLIIRTTVLFSRTENNFVAKIVKQLATGNKVKLYDYNIIGTPTYVPELAREVIRMTKEGYTGVAHVAGSRTMTRLHFARLIAKAFDFDPDFIIPTDETLEGAPRPPRAGLICDHDGYRKIKTHDIKKGLAELSRLYRAGEIWK